MFYNSFVLETINSREICMIYQPSGDLGPHSLYKCVSPNFNFKIKRVHLIKGLSMGLKISNTNKHLIDLQISNNYEDTLVDATIKDMIPCRFNTDIKIYKIFNIKTHKYGKPLKSRSCIYDYETKRLIYRLPSEHKFVVLGNFEQYELLGNIPQNKVKPVVYTKNHIVNYWYKQRISSILAYRGFYLC